MTVLPEYLSAGEMQVAKETVTQHIGMPIITEENSDEEGTVIEILTKPVTWVLIVLCILYSFETKVGILDHVWLPCKICISFSL